MTAQLHSLKRTKATGCWNSKAFCPSTEVAVNVSEAEAAAHAVKAESWFWGLRRHAHEHSRTPVLQLTTEELVLEAPAKQAAVFDAFFHGAASAARGVAPPPPAAEVRVQELPRATSWPPESVEDAPDVPRPDARQPKANGEDAASTCNLCAEHWVIVLATGRSGSTSIIEALNSLPGVSLAGENQGSLDVSSALLERFVETRAREWVAMNASGAPDQDDPKELLCAIQSWYRALVGIEAKHSSTAATAAPSQTALLGFKELVSLRSRSTWFDHADRLPPARRLPLDSEDASLE